MLRRARTQRNQCFIQKRVPRSVITLPKSNVKQLIDSVTQVKSEQSNGKHKIIWWTCFDSKRGWVNIIECLHRRLYNFALKRPQSLTSKQHCKNDDDSEGCDASSGSTIIIFCVISYEVGSWKEIKLPKSFVSPIEHFIHELHLIMIVYYNTY